MRDVLGLLEGVILMYEIGEQIVYGCQGVYRVEEITHLDMGQSDKERLYYVLVPVCAGTDKIYTPVDNQRINMRPVISREEAEAIIDEIPHIDVLTVTSERNREQQYKEALRSCDFHNWIRIIKTVYSRQEKRLAQGKKITALDERYLRTTENEAYGELSLALGIPKEQMVSYIRERIEG
jgi:CarD family transcriptional regulator